MAGSDIRQLAPAELARWREDPSRAAPVVLDVREPWELAICSLPGATAIPLRELPARMGELPDDRPIVCVCHVGGRSQQAAMFLKARGLSDVYNLRGGIAAWANEVEPSMARY
jgi:rhodanese-related sulfurtransferase